MNRKMFLNLFLLMVATACLCLVAPAVATTELHIVKYADDGTTIINETTVTWEWMQDNLPVLGDGSTHYYHQGPVFLDDAADPDHQEQLRLNPAEDTNVQDKDYGAVQGTNLKDLCNLVGGLSPGEEVTLKASDGMSKKFAYKNVYDYSSRQGPMVITWSRDGKTPGSGYDEAIKLVFFADTSTNPWGIHAFGNNDWHESADSKYWYYYYQGSNKYPTTTGLAVKYISELIIYSTTPASEVQPPTAAFSANPLSGTAPLTVMFSDQSTGSPTSWAWDFTNDGSADSTAQNPSYTFNTAGTYTVTLTSTNSYGRTNETKSGYITVSDSSDTGLNAAFSADPRSGTAPLKVKFTDTSKGTGITEWAWDFNNDGEIDSDEQNPRYTFTKARSYTVNLTVSGPNGTSSEVKKQYIRVNEETEETGNSAVTVSRTTVQEQALVTNEPIVIITSPSQQTTLKKASTTVATRQAVASDPPAESPGPDAVIVVAILAVCGLGIVLVRKYRYAK
jgi:PKD repeat protein